MAKYFFNASEHPVNTTLASLGFTDPFGYTVQEIFPGRFAWVNTIAASGFFARTLFDDYEGNDQEIVLLQDYSFTEHNISPLVLDAQLNSWDSVDGIYYQINRYSNGTLVRDIPTIFSSTQKDVNPTGFNTSLANGLRLSHIGTAVKARWWQAAIGTLAANEQTDWDFEATYTATTFNNYKAGIAPHSNNNAIGNIWYSAIGIGTAGSPAPSEAVPQQTVITPTNLTVSNITATGATLDWD